MTAAARTIAPIPDLPPSFILERSADRRRPHYQLTPLKTACLSHCRTPMGFLMSHWRDGAGGAFRMGLHHGGYCLGCCWALMLLMFVAGVMSVAAMAVLSLFILGERLLPGRWAAQVPGVALLAWGAWTLARSFG